MSMTTLAVTSPVVATVRLPLVVVCLPNLFHRDCSCFLCLSWFSFSTRLRGHTSGEVILRGCVYSWDPNFCTGVRHKGPELGIKGVLLISRQSVNRRPMPPFNKGLPKAILGQPGWAIEQLVTAARRTSCCSEPQSDLIHFTTSRSLLTFVLRWAPLMTTIPSSHPCANQPCLDGIDADERSPGMTLPHEIGLSERSTCTF